MSKKEKNAWDRFWIGVKENEKIIRVLLLLLLAPTFAFTGAFQSCMQQRAGGSNLLAFSIFGQDFTESDLAHARSELQMVNLVHPSQEFPDWSRQDAIRLITFKLEADRLGIRVSDEELGEMVRTVYQREAAKRAALESIRELTKDDKNRSLRGDILQRIAEQTMQTKFEELHKADRFNEAEWNSFLAAWPVPDRSATLSIQPQDLESALRDVMRAEKVRPYIMSTVQVTSQEAFEKFQQDEQSRKLSFFEVKADAAKPEVEKSVTDADVQARYEQRKEDFRQPTKLRVEYLSIPVEAFEKEAQITDADIQKEYDRVKLQKYRTWADEGSLDAFKPLSPAEKAARDAKAFRPLAEVKDEVRLDLVKSKAREAARAAAEKAALKLFPRKQGAIDGKTEQPAAKPETIEQVAKEIPRATTGTTPWVSASDAQKEMPPEAWSTQVSNWFRQIEGNPAMKIPPKKEVDAPRNYIASPVMEPQHYVLYAKPQVRPAGVPPLDEVKDQVRESLVKERLLDRAADRAKALADSIRDGKETFDAAAKEAGSKVVTTASLERTGTIEVPDDAAAPDGEKKEAPPPAPEAGKEAGKTKPHPGSYTILDYAFKALSGTGKMGFAKDEENGVCYVVRVDDVTLPEASKFDKDRMRSMGEVLQEKRLAYWNAWSRKLDLEANLMVPASERRGGEGPE